MLLFTIQKKNSPVHKDLSLVTNIFTKTFAKASNLLLAYKVVLSLILAT
ncbi:MAG: hypothetical protein UV38_C0001G0267 [candidate division TM6 bacterium GW2011_GWE2_42_60]|nr:MAG: hypothetical protein UV38_C0001G0267 [candidate division TM6 bacterium GW2011_GWE2_42_60]